MTILRLRPAYSDEELATVYDHMYDHTRWGDHVLRVQATVDLVHAVTIPASRRRVADLSCGDGAIARAVSDVEELYLGDMVPADHLNVVGRIEETVLTMPYVELFILSETLEHVDDPGELLFKIRGRASRIVLTTPLNEFDDGNPEHYWGWDDDGVRSLLKDAGWSPDHYEAWTPSVPYPYYTFQMWSAW